MIRANSMNPTFSIIIVSWNAKHYLAQCLDSLAHQVQPCNSEIVVVDNASSDGSYELVRDNFPDVKLIQTGRNLGFARANNIGMAQVRGKYVCLINSDVILREHCLSGLRNYMDQHPEIGILGPRILNPDLSIQESCKEFPTLWNSFCRALALDSLFRHSPTFSGSLMRYFAHDEIRPVDILSGCFWVVRRAALGQVGPLDEEFFMYAEDKDWCKRFWDAGWSVVYFPGAEAIHFGAASSSREPVRFYLEMNRANLLYWKKHYGRAQQLAIRAVMLLHESLRIAGSGLLFVMRPRRRASLSYNLRRSLACTRSLLLERRS